jgi:methylase of polypeptide subunit release factors
MKHVANLPEGKKLKLVFDASVYSPLHTSVDTIVAACIVGKDMASLVDVGCGSGLIGLGVKKVLPHLDVVLADTSIAALKIARKNAVRNKVSVRLVQSDLLAAVEYADIVTAFLPSYNDADMGKHRLYGPVSAYAASDDGFALYDRLLDECKDKCRVLIVEIQPRLRQRFREACAERGYRLAVETDFSFTYLIG